MSNYLSIAAVTLSLSDMLQAAVGSDVPGASVTVVRPDSGNSGLPNTGVNIYLYQVTPNVSWRNNDLPTRQSNGMLVQLPQAAVDLHYLFSFYGGETELEQQQLLGSTIRTLHSQPVLTRQTILNTIANHGFLSESDLADAVESVKFTHIPLNLEELSKLWTIFFQTPYVLSVAYQASVVFLTKDQQPFVPQPVREPVIHVQPSTSFGVTPKEPDALTGLQIWLSADFDITHDSLGSISKWGDRSGNDNHAIQNTNANQPKFVREGLNGKPVIRFDGVDDYLAIENLHYDTQGQISEITLFALVKSTSNENQIIASFDPGEYWEFLLRSAGTGGVSWHTRIASGGEQNLETAQTYTDGKWRLVNAWFNVATSPDKQIYVDGEPGESVDAHGGDNMGSGATRFGFIGVRSNAGNENGSIAAVQFLAGDLVEFILYNRALSEEERMQIEKYFVEKYT